MASESGNKMAFNKTEQREAGTSVGARAVNVRHVDTSQILICSAFLVECTEH